MVFSAFAHETVARRLVHLLKYSGVVAAGVLLATTMATRVPPGTPALVPVPRAALRRVRFGIDPAAELAHRISAITGIPVVPALRAPLWWPSHAGGSRESREGPRFIHAAAVDAGAVLVDDVFTTGATMESAARILGLKTALTATRADIPLFG